MQLTDYPELTADICYILGKVYRRVNWQKMSNAKATAYDIFQHRLRTAANNSSVIKFLSKLCDGLSLQAPLIEAELLEKLEFQAPLVLRMIRSWSQYFTYRASIVKKMLKNNKKYNEITQTIIDSILQKDSNKKVEENKE